MLVSQSTELFCDFVVCACRAKPTSIALLEMAGILAEVSAERYSTRFSEHPQVQKLRNPQVAGLDRGFEPPSKASASEQDSHSHGSASPSPVPDSWDEELPSTQEK